MTSEQAQPEITIAPMSPYHAALRAICLAALAVAALLAGIGAQMVNSYGGEGAVKFVWAGLLSSVGLGCGLLWLLVGALTWKPRARVIIL